MIFQRGFINSLQLPNRIIRSATWDGLATSEGDATSAMGDLFERLSKGGAGLIMTGFCSVHKSGRIFPYMLGIESDDRIYSLSRLTRRIHESGGFIGIQLSHGGIHARPRLIFGEKIRTVSPKENVQRNDIYRHMTLEDIDEMTEAFTEAAIRAKGAGFDLIQIQAGHGYLINQFLSPLTNRRQDIYGGSSENRARFLFDVCRRVRCAVGKDFPITVKLNGSDMTMGGITIEDAVDLARQLQKLCIDAVEITGGLTENSKYGPIRCVSSTDQEGYFISFAKIIKQQVPKMQTIAVGGIRSLEMAQHTLLTGSADYIALCRPLIRETNLPKRWQAKQTDKSSCISCNKCFTPGLHGKGVQCVQEN